MMSTRTLRAQIQAGPYAWPGGYPRLAVMADGESLCLTDCLSLDKAKAGDREARSVVALVFAAHARPQYRDAQWTVAGFDIHWEGPPEVCVHCGADIPSAYGNPDDDADAPASQE
jgi:hypothetical protein